MRSVVPLARTPDLAVAAVDCRDDHTGWSSPEVRAGYSVVLVRRGRFRWRSGHTVATVDPTVAYLSVPAEEERFAHPAGGDACTWLNLSVPLWQAVAGDSLRLERRTFYVDGRLDLAHRRLLAATGDAGFALVEELIGLVSTVVRRSSTGLVPGGGAGGGRDPRVDRALVTAAREAILAGDASATGLLPLAQALGVSPYRLSRAFPRELGVSLTRYRNRARVGRALDRIEAGEHHLGRLAADLGFADQAHLCRTVRAHLGHTPRALVRALGPPADRERA
jgi:AraC-like DNA-binding protein